MLSILKSRLLFAIMKQSVDGQCFLQLPGGFSNDIPWHHNSAKYNSATLFLAGGR